VPPDDRTRLAVIGGFTKPRDSIAHGTHHAAFIACEAIAATAAYSGIDVFHENAAAPAKRGEVILPKAPPSRLLDKTAMPLIADRYQSIYVANGEQIGPSPYALRPQGDWAPVICSVGTTHAGAQWQSLLVALMSHAVRASDGFVFKSRPAERLFREVWTDWAGRIPGAPVFPAATTVIPNGVDVEANRPSPKLREETRQQLRVRADDVVFLAFSRLSPGTKGDQLALIVRWKEVIQQFPQALLVLAGAQVDRAFTMEQRQLARAAGVADRVMIIENPFDVLPLARFSLMSMADVFVHLTTGIEEASPLVVSEALAHALPVIATDWAGIPEIVRDGDNGFVIPTRVAPASPLLSTAVFGVTDLFIGLAASKLVSCDFENFVERALVLADPRRRRAMGAAARRDAESRAIATVARQYVDFFARVSAEARAKWNGSDAFRPLLDMDRVLGVQTSGRLHPGDRLAAGNLRLAGLLSEGWQPDEQQVVAGAVSAFEGTTQMTQMTQVTQITQITIEELAAKLAGGNDPRRAYRLIVRLLNYGVLRRVS
jgi:glycosyltransferase involved in cell wall biosynthesis